MNKMRQWTILTAVGVVVVLAAGWMLLVSPQRSHAAQLRSDAQAQQTSNQQLQSQVSQLREQQKGLPAQQKKLSDIAARIPDNPALPALIRQLSDAATAAGVDLVSLAPGQPAVVSAAAATTVKPTVASGKSATSHAPVTSPLAQIPVTVQVTGTYFNLESFFAAVEKIRRSVLVTGFTISGGTGSSTGGTTAPTTSSSSTAAPGTLTAQLSAVVFESPQIAAPTTTSLTTSAAK